MNLIPVYKGRGNDIVAYATVDDADFLRLKDFRYVLEHGYPRRHLGDLKYVKLHHDVIGFPLQGYETHHKDEDTLNAQRHNLEQLTFAQHLQKRVSGRSKFVGVFLNTLTGSWRAKVKKAGRQYHCGSFDTEEQAAVARDKKAFELFGVNCTFNFPEDYLVTNQ